MIGNFRLYGYKLCDRTANIVSVAPFWTFWWKTTISGLLAVTATVHCCIDIPNPLQCKIADMPRGCLY